MNSRFLRVRSAIVTILVVLATATAASAFPFPLRQLYMIQGYLDRAPEGTTVIDQIQIAAANEPTRWLLVTAYRNPGDVLLDQYLSHELISRYLVMGKSDEVVRLLGAPEGARARPDHGLVHRRRELAVSGPARIQERYLVLRLYDRHEGSVVSANR